MVSPLFWTGDPGKALRGDPDAQRLALYLLTCPNANMIGIRLGILDGMPGLIYYVNQSFWYRFYVDSRIYELKSNWKEIGKDYKDI